MAGAQGISIRWEGGMDKVFDQPTFLSASVPSTPHHLIHLIHCLLKLERAPITHNGTKPRGHGRRVSLNSLQSPMLQAHALTAEQNP